ncbi:unnamed protein product [Brugia timori]|uniref:Uncharacterized protein n=1 Tax=Brugia timori TaxID=42155 RepID=A0A0R3Q5A4_9BILA|nr:unnamed protein product [Brugia timori]
MTSKTSSAPDTISVATSDINIPEKEYIDLTEEDFIELGYTAEELVNVQLTRLKKKELYIKKKLQFPDLVNQQDNQFFDTPGVTPVEETSVIEKFVNKKMPDKHIMLPPFTPNNVNLWLKSVKGRLKAHDIDDKELFKRIRMDMPLEIIDRIPEILEPTLAQDNFKWFSDQLIEEFGKTKEQDIRELLNKCSLDDQGPKRLMQKMLDKSKDGLKPFIIADLFKQKLPKEIARMVVSFEEGQEVQNEEDLKRLAERAEKLYQFENECISPYKSTVSAVSDNKTQSNNKKGQYKETSNTNSSSNKEINDLRSQVGNLKKQLDEALSRIERIERGGSGQVPIPYPLWG